MLPPSRPSAQFLDFVRTYVVRTPAQTEIAVLGSTPELRDLCVEEGRPKVHVLDRSEAFHRLCSSLLVYHNPSESIHRGDWLDLLPAMPSSFDLILSDLTLGNIPYERRPEFFDRIRGALRPGGLFLDKVLTHPEELLPLTRLDRRYRTKPFNLQTLNDFANEYFFLSQLIADGIVDIERLNGLLSERFEDVPRLGRYLKESLRLVTPGGIWFYGRPWRLIQPTYAKGLHLVEERLESPPSVFAGNLRMFAFEKRTS